MNERIEKMMLEATKDIPQGYYVPPQYFEKFAELIVRECAAVAGKFVHDNKYKEGGISEFWLKDGIKEHFGVEE